MYIDTLELPAEDVSMETVSEETPMETQQTGTSSGNTNQSASTNRTQNTTNQSRMRTPVPEPEEPDRPAYVRQYVNEATLPRDEQIFRKFLRNPVLLRLIHVKDIALSIGLTAKWEAVLRHPKKLDNYIKSDSALAFEMRYTRYDVLVETRSPFYENAAFKTKMFVKCYKSLYNQNDYTYGSRFGNMGYRRHVEEKDLPKLSHKERVDRSLGYDFDLVNNRSLSYDPPAFNGRK